MKSFLEALFFLIKDSKWYNKVLENQLHLSDYYYEILSNSFLTIVLGGLAVSGIFYILFGRINFKFANIYLWIAHLLFSGLIVSGITYLLILSAYSQGQGLFYYDSVLYDFEISIVWMSGVYSMIFFILFSLVFKTRYFTVYSRNIPF